MILLIDDVRNFHADIVLRTAKAAIEFFIVVGDNMSFEKVYLDFDLGDGIGLDVLKQAIFSNAIIPKIILVTMNPVGRKQMGDYLIDNGYHSYDGFEFNV
jgi:hypothetical protein